MKIIVLGAGLVGGPMAIDLSKDPRFEVTLADHNTASLDEPGSQFHIKTLQMDLSDPAVISNLVKDYDMVVNALPGFMGYNTFKAVIDGSGKGTIVSLSANSVLSGFEIRNGTIGVFSKDAGNSIVNCRIINNCFAAYACHWTIPSRSGLPTN